jgi:hypothetical protein
MPKKEKDSDNYSTERENPTEVSSEKYKNYAEDPLLAKKAVAFVKDLKSSLKKKRRPFELVWAECQDAYRCIERKTYFQGLSPYCSSDLRDAVLVIVPKICKSVWYSDTPFDLVPIGEEGDDDQLSDINKKVLEWDFRNLKIYLKYVDSMFQKAIFGTNIVKTPPHFEMITKNIRNWKSKSVAGVKMKKELSRESEEIRTYMGTDMVVVDLFDFWIDPSTVSRGMNDPIEYGDCIESIYVRKTDLEAGKESGIYVNTDKIMDKFLGSKKISNSDDSSINRRVKLAGHIQQTDIGAQKTISKDGNPLYALDECYADFDLGRGIERCLIVESNGECIRLQPWEDDKPYLSSRYVPNGYNKEFYGTGIIETNLPNHYERNATRKQIMAARTMGLNMEMLSDQTGFSNKPDKLRTAPNKVHYVKNINGVKPFDKPIGQILQSGVMYESNLKSETQLATGNTPYIQGADTSKINDTARGINALMGAGNERFTLPLQVDETGMLEPFVKRSLNNNVTYRTSDFIIRLTDKSPFRVEPDKLSANFDVYSKGFIEMENKQRKEQGLEKAYKLSLESAQIEAALYGKPTTNFTELKKEMFKVYGLVQPEKYVTDPMANQAPQALKPKDEWTLLKMMAEGQAPPRPILIQPGEDFKDHFDSHVSMLNTEDWENMPDPIKAIWIAHIQSYDKVLNYLEDQKKEAIATKDIETKEVAVSV